MQASDFLLVLSWVFSMLMMFAVGFAVSMAIVNKQKAQMTERFFNILEGVKNAIWNTDRQDNTDTTNEVE